MFKNYATALILGGMFSSLAFADVSFKYCEEQGGTLVEFVRLNEKRRPTNIQKVFCQLMNEGEGTKTVDPETLANPRNTIAVELFRAAQSIGDEPVAGSVTPAYTYCVSNLKGLYSNWREKTTGSESGTCAFADGSVISDWALVYGSKRLPKLNEAFANRETR